MMIKKYMDMTLPLGRKLSTVSWMVRIGVIAVVLCIVSFVNASCRNDVATWQQYKKVAFKKQMDAMVGPANMLKLGQVVEPLKYEPMMEDAIKHGLLRTNGGMKFVYTSTHVLSYKAALSNELSITGFPTGLVLTKGFVPKIDDEVWMLSQVQFGKVVFVLGPTAESIRQYERMELPIEATPQIDPLDQQLLKVYESRVFWKFLFSVTAIACLIFALVITVYTFDHDFKKKHEKSPSY